MDFHEILRQRRTKIALTIVALGVVILITVTV